MPALHGLLDQNTLEETITFRKIRLPHLSGMLKLKHPIYLKVEHSFYTFGVYVFVRFDCMGSILMTNDSVL